MPHLYRLDREAIVPTLAFSEGQVGYIHEVTNSSPAQTGKRRPSLQPDARAKLLTTTVFQARMWAKMSGGNRKQVVQYVACFWSWRKRPLTDCGLRNIMKVMTGADNLFFSPPPLLQFLFQRFNKTHPPPLQYDVLQLNGYFLRRSDKLHENMHFFFLLMLNNAII